MSLLPMSTLAKQCRTVATPIVRQRRLASSDSHHHHEEAHDSTEYPKEGFSGPFWRNTAVAAIALTGLVAFKPSEILSGGASNDIEDAPWLTRILAHNASSKDTWAKINERHLEQVGKLASNTHIVQSAKQPEVHRFRYASGFEQFSAHRLPVGGGADLSDLEVKGDSL